MSIHPDFLEAIAPLMKDKEELSNYLAAAPLPLKKSISIVTSRFGKNNDTCDGSTPKEKLLQYTPQDWELNPTVFGGIDDQWYIDREDTSLALGKHFLHLCGFFYMQEVAAGLPAHFLDIPAGGLVLDMSAAPGGKTIQLANRMLGENPENPGVVLANDYDWKRMMTMGTNINRTSMHPIISCNFDGSAFGNLFPETFDAILVDAPCSGEGTHYKSDSALKRRKQESINKVAGTQGHLLTAALKAVKVGGSIIYSTCTLNITENEQIVADLLEKYGDAVELKPIALSGHEIGYSSYHDKKLLSQEQAEKLVRCWPHKQKTGGFFIAKLRKTASIHTGSTKKKNKAYKPKSMTHMQFDHSKKLQKTIEDYLHETFGIDVDPQQFMFVASKHKVFCTHPRAKDLINHIPLPKIGVPILKIHSRTFSPLHNLGTVFGHLATKNTVEFDEETLQSYALFNNISVEKSLSDTLEQGNRYAIVLRKNYGVSVTKRVDDTYKNKFFKWGN